MSIQLVNPHDSNTVFQIPNDIFKVTLLTLTTFFIATMTAGMIRCIRKRLKRWVFILNEKLILSSCMWKVTFDVFWPLLVDEPRTLIILNVGSMSSVVHFNCGNVSFCRRDYTLYRNLFYSTRSCWKNHAILFSGWYKGQNCSIIVVSCAWDNTDRDVFNLKLYQRPLDWYLTYPQVLEVWTSRFWKSGPWFEFGKIDQINPAWYARYLT